MARSKTYRRTRNSFALGLALLVLWFLDLGGSSPKEGKREKEQAPTQSEAERGAEGDREVRQGHSEPAKSTDEPVGTETPGPVRQPPEDVLAGHEATFERYLLDEDYRGARDWIAREIASLSPMLRQLASKCEGRLRSVGEEQETYLRSRLQAIRLEEAEQEVALFSKDWPKRMEGLLVELPDELKSTLSPEEIETWSQKINAGLPAEIEGKGRLLRLSKGKTVLRVPGDAGGFRHVRVELTSLPPARMLALSPASEEREARRFLSRLYAQSGLPVSANWLFFGEVRVQHRAPDPGR